MSFSIPIRSRSGPGDSEDEVWVLPVGAGEQCEVRLAVCHLSYGGLGLVPVYVSVIMFIFSLGYAVNFVNFQVLLTEYLQLSTLFSLV